MSIAPHEGRELEYVMLGIKPLASLDVNKQPEQFKRALRLKHAVTVYYHTNNLITITRPENDDLHNVFAVLSTNEANILVRTAEEKHRLLGRLFGYSEEDIDSFIAAGLECACGQCNWNT